MPKTQFQDCVVYVIDDDEALLTSLEWLLQSVPFNVKSYTSANAFLNEIDTKCQGCVVTDLRMPEMNGLELQKALKKRNIDLPVIVMSAYGQIGLAVEAMKQGIVDFIEKPFDDQQFVDIINNAIRHRLEQVGDREKISKIHQRLANLTQREQQICRLIVQGHTNRQIAKALNISEKTVEAHRAQVMRKMEAGSMAELIRMVLVADPEFAGHLT